MNALHSLAVDRILNSSVLLAASFINVQIYNEYFATCIYVGLLVFNGWCTLCIVPPFARPIPSVCVSVTSQHYL